MSGRQDGHPELIRPGDGDDLPLVTESEAIHKLKNLLSIILGFSELLLTDFPADDPRAADLNEIRTAAENALTLCRRLPSFPAPSGQQ